MGGSGSRKVKYPILIKQNPGLFHIGQDFVVCANTRIILWQVRNGTNVHPDRHHPASGVRPL
jgi:hypothetical protein